MFRELKPKFAVSAHTQWSVSSPGSCELKPQAVPGLAQDSDCWRTAVRKVWSLPALRLPRGPSETNDFGMFCITRATV